MQSTPDPRTTTPAPRARNDYPLDSRDRRPVDDQNGGRLLRRARENPIGTLALALGATYLLTRTDLLPSPFTDSEPERSRDPLRELLLAWLNDAYAMELALVPVLKSHADDAKDYPRIRKRDLQHREETKRHAELVKDCIRLRNEDRPHVRADPGR